MGLFPTGNGALYAFCGTNGPGFLVSSIGRLPGVRGEYDEPEDVEGAMERNELGEAVGRGRLE